MAGLKSLGVKAECFARETPINSSNWAVTIDHVSVLVMTAQSFLNVLRDRTASFRQIALMVSILINPLASTVMRWYSWWTLSHCRNAGLSVNVKVVKVVLVMHGRLVPKSYHVLLDLVSHTIQHSLLCRLA